MTATAQRSRGDRACIGAQRNPEADGEDDHEQAESGCRRSWSNSHGLAAVSAPRSEVSSRTELYADGCADRRASSRAAASRTPGARRSHLRARAAARPAAARGRPGAAPCGHPNPSRLERPQRLEQPVDLFGRVVVEHPGAHCAVWEAEPFHHLDRVVVPAPDRQVALAEPRGRVERREASTLKQNVGTRPSIVGRP